jgi:hypothetical protein
MRHAFSFRFPPVGQAEAALDFWRPATARRYDRTPGPADSRTLADNRLTRQMAIDVLERWNRPIVRLQADPRVEDRPTMYPNLNDLQRAFGVTWGQLVELEPHLDTLLGWAKLACASNRTFPDVDQVFGPLRDELAALIGFAGKHHSHPILGSAGAYEVAYWTLYDAVASVLSGGAAGARESVAKQRGSAVCPLN